MERVCRASTVADPEHLLGVAQTRSYFPCAHLVAEDERAFEAGGNGIGRAVTVQSDTTNWDPTPERL